MSEQVASWSKGVILFDERDIPDPIEPTSICEFQAGERIAWPNVMSERVEGTIHKVWWMYGRWWLGVWCEKTRQLNPNGEPRLHLIPLGYINTPQIERVSRETRPCEKCRHPDARWCRWIELRTPADDRYLDQSRCECPCHHIVEETKLDGASGGD